MSHQIRNDASTQRYILSIDGQDAGYLSYLSFRGTIDLEHTEVAEEFAGQGVASELARHALDDIKGREMNVMISCPAVRSFLNKNPQYASLLIEP